MIGGNTHFAVCRALKIYMKYPGPIVHKAAGVCLSREIMDRSGLAELLLDHLVIIARAMAFRSRVTVLKWTSVWLVAIVSNQG